MIYKKTTLPLALILGAIVSISCSGSDNQTESASGLTSDTTIVDLWNGNRSQIRQVYEKEVLIAVLTATEDDFGPWKVMETLDEYLGDEEGLVFSEYGHDLFVTIAGNQKFGEGDKIMISTPMTKNLLGYRIPIIREEDSEKFQRIGSIEEAQQLVHGIPETWSDAVIFRENGFRVVEDGDFDDIFYRLENGLFDYSAYGVNEVVSVFQNRASKRNGLAIDENLMFYYPFPLVFYVNPDLPRLADRIEQGMQRIIDSGGLDAIFTSYYGDVVETLNLENRMLFILENPLIPDEFRDLRPDLSLLSAGTK